MSGGPIGHLVGGGSLLVGTGRQLDDDHDVRSTAPVEGRSTQGSSEMYHGDLYQELARQRHREAYLQARRARLARAARAGRRARRAVELAVRAGERAAR